MAEQADCVSSRGRGNNGSSTGQADPQNAVQHQGLCRQQRGAGTGQELHGDHVRHQ